MTTAERGSTTAFPGPAAGPGPGRLPAPAGLPAPAELPAPVRPPVPGGLPAPADLPAPDANGPPADRGQLPRQSTADGPPGQALPPLMLVGHGTRSSAGVAEFGRLVARVRARAAGQVPAVDGGFIELAGPPVAEVVARLVPRDGLGQIVAVPLVLTAAGHGKGDIPAALARERLRHPGLSYRYGRPLGPHPALQDVLAARIDAALDGASRGGTHVVLVGRGSTDPDGNAEVAKVARLLWEGRGFAEVEFGFVSLAEPSVPAALERARRLGARRVVVAPYFLFPGVLPDRVVEQSRAFAAGNPGISVRAAGLIGDCDQLADLVLERYREALAGDIRMNCDTCAYRVALPGFADKLGRPQLPHYHPADHDHDHGAAGHDHAAAGHDHAAAGHGPAGHDHGGAGHDHGVAGRHGFRHGGHGFPAGKGPTAANHSPEDTS